MLEKLLPYLMWPAATVVIVLLLAAIFWRPIARLIDRIKSGRLGSAGFDTSVSQQQAQAEESAGSLAEAVKPLNSSTVRPARDALDNPLIKFVEDLIRKDPVFSSEKDATEQQDYLIRLLASSRISFAFERTYRLIFGSQLRALRFLAGLPEPIDKTFIRPFYDAAANADPEFYASYSFDSWSAFLERVPFVVTADAGKIRISPMGREFLKHLIDMGYSDSKGH